MAVSGLGGLFLGLLIVMGLRVTNTSIKTVDEAEALLGMSVVSVVPNMRGLKKKKRSPLVVVERAKSQGAEAFRTLRTSLSTLGRAEERRVCLFTSALPAEGKTLCALNYSASLALLGLKTLLIDADMRRPTIETALAGSESGAPGITDYLTGKKKLEEVVQAAKVENLFFIAGGTTAANPAELVAKDGLSELIKEALLHYDRVVLDSAPINAVSDTLLMLRSVQSVCLVVRAARTSSRYVLRCVQLLQGAEAPLSGVVLNRMPGRRSGGYGAYYDYRYQGKYDKAGVYAGG
jgi:capsular exopolysaccharide synthesis family protein